MPATSNREHGALPMLWLLTLVGCAVPALLLGLVVRAVVDEFEPGLGTATATLTMLGTLVLPFSTLFFVHVLSALLGFGSFALARRARRPAGFALAGFVGGLAGTCEYALVLTAAALAVYVLAVAGVRAAGAYVGGAAAGLVPIAVYDLWAFGSVFHLSYADAIARRPGTSGHDVLGLNAPGLFGLQTPRLHVALDLLVSARGLLLWSPVVACAAARARRALPPGTTRRVDPDRRGLRALPDLQLRAT